MSDPHISIPDWARRTAETLGDGPHVVVSGISPSGNIHAGNLREVLVAEAVARALKDRGHEVRFIFHADTIDPLRKIAPGVPQSYEQFIGHSLSRIPDPEGCHASYAEHFLAPFEETLLAMGMEVEVLRSHELYEQGTYTQVTRESLERKDDLRRILQEVTGRSMPEGNEWSPYQPRAASGSLIGNRVIAHRLEDNKVVFEDGSGNEDEADYARGEGKLGWRVELAARWKALGVTFEPFGKDHTSRGGSTDTADRMSEEVFGYPVPGRYEYEWISIKGRGAMSSSKGIVLLPGDLLRIMPPDALRKMMLGRDPARALDLDLESGFPRFMDEYRERQEHNLVSFAHLATISQIVGDDVFAAEKILLQGGYRQDTSDLQTLSRYLNYAKNWSESWAPESYRFKVLDLDESKEAAKDLDGEQLKYLSKVAVRLDSSMDGETVQSVLYETSQELELKPKKAFAAIYAVLLGRKNGPKAGPFIAQIGVWIVQPRLLKSGESSEYG